MGDYTSIKLMASVDAKSAEAIHLAHSIHEHQPRYTAPVNIWENVALNVDDCPDWVGMWGAITRSNFIPFGGIQTLPREFDGVDTVVPTPDSHVWGFSCSVKSGWWVGFFLERILPQMLTAPCEVWIYDEAIDDDVRIMTINPEVNP